MKTLIITIAFLTYQIAWSGVDASITSDKVKLGVQGNTSADKIIEFNKGAGASNPKIKLDGATGKIKYAHNGTTFKTINLGTDIDSTGGSNGQVLTANGSGSASWLNVGSPVAPVHYVYVNSGYGPYTGNVTSGSACIASPSSTYGIAPGMGIADSTHSANVPTGTYVVGIPGSCSSGQIQMSNNAAGTNTGDSFTFGQMPNITANTTSGSACLASPSSLASIVVGAPIIAVTNPSDIPAGTTVAGLPGACSAGQIQMSANAAGTHTGGSITVGQTVISPTGNSNPVTLEVELLGGGGGGGGSCSTTSGAAGTAGISSIFGPSAVLVSNPGQGGRGCDGNLSPSAGGTCTGAISSSFTGWAQCWTGTTGQGGGGFGISGTGGGTSMGGSGGSSPFGGGGGGGSGFGEAGLGTAGSSAGAAGTANTGSGGGGGGVSTTSVNAESGAGGSAAAYIRAAINSPSGTYPVLVGYGGLAGSGNVNSGGAGGSGVAVLTFKYQ